MCPETKEENEPKGLVQEARQTMSMDDSKSIVGGRHDQPMRRLRQTTTDSPLLRFRAESSIFFHSVFIQFREDTVEEDTVEKVEFCGA